MLDIVVPLIENGLSPEAVWMSNPDLPVAPHLPVLRWNRAYSHSRDRAAPQGPLPPAQEKTHGPAAARPGREYADFFGAFQEERDSAVEVDSVIGYAGNRARILSFHAVRAVFSSTCAWKGPGSAPVVGACDMLERCWRP